MKQLLWIFFLSILSISFIVAQTIERPKKEIPLITEPVAELSNAEGWMLQNNGEWVSSKNQIPFKNYSDNKRRGGMFNLGKENFDLISVRSITIDEVVYSILLVYFQQGEYQFPLLRENWDQYNAVTYYVFDEQKWSRIFPDSITFNKPYAVNTELVCQGTIADFNERTYLFDIENHIRQAIYQQDISITTMIFAAFPISIRGEKFFRFKFYQTINKREIFIKYLLERNWPKLFGTFYYEIDLEYFTEFFNNINVIDKKRINEPTYFTHFLKSGIEKFNKKEFKSSVQSLTKALMVNPPDSALISILYWRGKAKLELNVFDEAFEDLDSAVNIKPNTDLEKETWIAAHYERGNAYNGRHEYQNACEDWNFALQNGYRNAFEQIRKFCGKISDDGNLTINIQKSERLFQKALEQFEKENYFKALNLFQKSWLNNHLTMNFKIPYYIGFSRYNLGDYVRSLDEFDMAVNMKPDPISPDFDFWPNTLVQRGLAWQKIGYDYEACQDWFEAKKIDNDIADGLYETYCTEFDFDFFDKAIIKANDEEKAFASYNSGDFENAVKYLNHTIAASRDSSEIRLFNYRAKARHKLGDFTGAIEDFTTVLKNIPNEGDTEIRRFNILFNRGVSKFFAGYLDDACADWQSAVEEGLTDVNAFEYINTFCKP
jgi:tetratricopeptide (TPR) repeat protein